jgi:hypothetical protein
LSEDEAMSDEKKMYVRLIAMFVVICTMIALGSRERSIFSQLYVLLLSLSILIYLGSITYLMGYLRRIHAATWMDLGQPAMSVDFARNNTFQFAQSGFLTLGYVFSSRYKKLEDDRLNVLIWLIRVLLLLSLVLFSGLFLLDPGRVPAGPGR